MDILAINHYKVTPPNSGGSQRIYWLYSKISKNNNVEIVDWQAFFDSFPKLNSNISRTNITESCIETTYRDCTESFLRKAYIEKLSGSPNQLKIGKANVLSRKKQILEKVKQSDILVLEHPVSFIDEFSDHQLVYDAHNFEYGLAKDIGREDKYLRKIHEKEKKVVESSNHVICVSEEDKQNFVQEYEVEESDITVVPNGAPKIENADYNPQERDYGFFIGSGHPPNIEAANLIFDMARELEEENFVIAGTVCNELTNPPENVELKGLVSEEEKEKLYRKAKYGLNPMISGSGTNVKVLEYFQHHLPVLSTEKGARGGLKDYVGITKNNDFSKKISSMDSKEWKDLSNKSRNGIEKYNYENLAQKLNNLLNNLS